MFRFGFGSSDRSSHLVIQRLKNIHLGLNLRLLRLAHAIHVDLAPRYFDPLFLVITFVHCFERAMAELLVEL